jgi:hypothetical protein
MLDALAIAPTMQAIVVDGIPVVDPQFASIIGDDAESVVAVPPDSQSACPTDGKVIAPDKALPFAIRVAIVHCLDSASHPRSAAIQILASTALCEVVDPFHEAMAISTSASRTLS